jgi:hypothetical protein
MTRPKTVPRTVKSALEMPKLTSVRFDTKQTTVKSMDEKVILGGDDM